MSMLGSPVGGASYLFVDPTSVWRREPEHESAKAEDGMDKARLAAGQGQGGEGGVRVLLPSERERVRRKSSPTMTTSTSTTYSLSHQPLTNFPHPPHHQHDPGVLPGFIKRRSVRVPGWELYAVDGWVMDRGRRWCCVVTGGDRRDPKELNGQDTNGHHRPSSAVAEKSSGKDLPGVLMDEYVPISTSSQRHSTDPTSATHQPNHQQTNDHVESRNTSLNGSHSASRNGFHTDEEDLEPWEEALHDLQAAVEADGGRLEQVDFHDGTPTSRRTETSSTTTTHTSSTAETTSTPSRTKTYLPVTPLPYLPHGLIPIPIPTGNYADTREELYMNLGLRRLGCSGRSSVGLGVPR